MPDLIRLVTDPIPIGEGLRAKLDPRTSHLVYEIPAGTWVIGFFVGDEYRRLVPEWFQEDGTYSLARTFAC